MGGGFSGEWGGFSCVIFRLGGCSGGGIFMWGVEWGRAANGQTLGD